MIVSAFSSTLERECTESAASPIPCVPTRGSTSNSRTFKGFSSREHFHDNISTVTFCKANNMAFVSNLRPYSFPMFVKLKKRTHIIF